MHFPQPFTEEELLLLPPEAVLPLPLPPLVLPPVLPPPLLLLLLPDAESLVVLWLRRTLAGKFASKAAGNGCSAMCTKAALRVMRWSSREKRPRRRARPTKKSATCWDG